MKLKGEFEEIIKKLYSVFNNDFNKCKRTLNDCPIWWDKRKINSQFEEGFWHLITKAYNGDNDRLINFRRAERIPWCGPSISNVNDGIIKHWEYEEKKYKIRTYIWLEKYDYIIILEKRKIKSKKNKIVYFLITAYYVEGDSSRRKLRRKYKNRYKMQSPL